MKPDDLYLIKPINDVFLANNVRNRKEPILTVIRYEDDCSWGFYSQHEEPENCTMAGLAEVITIDPSLRRIAKLMPGQRASRKNLTSEWIVQQINTAFSRAV